MSKGKLKGFTLIELLAVIVILAIIALIATPIVMNVIENARKGAAERSVENYLSSVETAVAAARLDGKIPSGSYKIQSDGSLCPVIGCGIDDIDKIKIDMNGNYPSDGRLMINNDGTIELNSIEVNEYICSSDGKCNKSNIENTNVTNGVITLEDSKSTILSNYIIKGNSYQATRSGKNLFDINNIKTDSYYFDISKDDYKITATRKHEAAENIFTKEMNIASGTKLILSTQKIYSTLESTEINNLNSCVRIRVTYEDGSYGYAYNAQLFTLTKNAVAIDIQFNNVTNSLWANGETVVFEGVMLEINDTATSYEPYGVMPSPEFPSEIQSVGDIVTEENNPNKGKYEIPINVTGKNLLKSTENVLGSLLVDNGGSINNLDYVTTTDYIFLKAGTYTISYKSGAALRYVALFNKDKKLVKSLWSNRANPYTFTIDEDYLARIDIEKSGNIKIDNIETFLTEYEVQLESGSQATDYEPYNGKKYSVYLDEPLRCTNSVCDYIDYENNQVVRNVGVFNFSKLYKELGSSYIPYKQNQWYRIGISDQESIFNKYGDGIANYSSTSDKNILGYSNYYKTSDWNNLDQKTSGFGQYTANGTIYLYLDMEYLAITLEDTQSTAYNKVINWIKSLSEDVVVTYTLKEPNITKIDLPDIKLNKGVSNITVETKINPSEFKVDYYK